MDEPVGYFLGLFVTGIYFRKRIGDVLTVLVLLHEGFVELTGIAAKRISKEVYPILAPYLGVIGHRDAVLKMRRPVLLEHALKLVLCVRILKVLDRLSSVIALHVSPGRLESVLGLCRIFRYLGPGRGSVFSP